jgi:hypothetical protein
LYPAVAPVSYYLTFLLLVVVGAVVRRLVYRAMRRRGL